MRAFKFGKLFAVVAVTMSLAFGAFGMAMAEDTLKIGVAGAHSGDLASYGMSALRGAEYVVDQINAKGGVLGKQVEIVKGDEQCKPELATNVATKMVTEKIPVVMGHICSGATKAALGIYKDAKVITISPSATNPALTQSGDYPNFFRTIASDDAQARMEVDFAWTFSRLKEDSPCCMTKATTEKDLAEFAKSFLEDGSSATWNWSFTKA